MSYLKQSTFVRNESYLDRKTMLSITKKLKGKYRAVIRIAFYSGMRLSEILNCTLSDGRMVVKVTKSSCPRIIPMHNKIKSCAKYIPLEIPKITIQAQFQAARKELGLGHIHIQDLFHFYINKALIIQSQATIDWMVSGFCS